MIITLNNQPDPNKTLHRALPYTFHVVAGGKMWITNVRGQTLIVTRTQVVSMLEREDLDVHRRRMYEAALAEFDKAKVQ